MSKKIIGIMLSLVLVLMMIPMDMVYAQGNTVYVSGDGVDTNSGATADTAVKKHQSGTCTG